MRSPKVFAAPVTGIVAAVLYGVLARFLIGRNTDILGTLSLSFLVFTPPVLGYLTVALATDTQKLSVRFAILAPWITSTLCVLIAGLFAFEAWFCIALGFPLVLVLSSLGGVFAWLVAKRRKASGTDIGAFAFFAVAPFLFVSVERLLPMREYVNTVHSQITISAPPEIIWQNITDLRAISSTEERQSFFHLVGLPRPLQAEMSCQHVGCTRYGQWEDGLAFSGLITRLEPSHQYELTLTADTQSVLPTRVPLSQIGGPVFAMIDDGYRIEALGNGHSILHLTSTYRITTRINSYGSLWLDILLRDIQRYILNIEKARCESEVK